MPIWRIIARRSGPGASWYGLSGTFSVMATDVTRDARRSKRKATSARLNSSARCSTRPGTANAPGRSGAKALKYDQCAEVLTRELGREVRYARPGLRYLRHAHGHLGMPRAMAAVTGAIYTTRTTGVRRPIDR
jgi:hypothetical protein